ncbi:hypothetical protein BSLA_01r1087 [Burkholderia stabilis]|nr:hypothetical protein BSLA_01r1087 [Burkholderia stabilis]
MFNVVLVAPEIPPNTGNVIRLCANTGATLAAAAHALKAAGAARVTNLVALRTARD